MIFHEIGTTVQIDFQFQEALQIFSVTSLYEN